jgi:hypothetical protein
MKLELPDAPNQIIGLPALRNVEVPVCETNIIPPQDKWADFTIAGTVAPDYLLAEAGDKRIWAAGANYRILASSKDLRPIPIMLGNAPYTQPLSIEWNPEDYVDFWLDVTIVKQVNEILYGLIVNQYDAELCTWQSSVRGWRYRIEYSIDYIGSTDDAAIAFTWASGWNVVLIQPAVWSGSFPGTQHVTITYEFEGGPSLFETGVKYTVRAATNVTYLAGSWIHIWRVS